MVLVCSGGDDDGLVELLWCNGHVVMQSQAPRKGPTRPEKAPAAVAVQDDEAAAWFQYPVAAEDHFERDLFTELFGEASQAAADAAGGGRACKEEAECAGDAAPRSGGMMPPPPRPREKAFAGDLGDVEDGAAATATEAAGESSMLTIGSSFCGSNHVQTPRGRAPCDGAPPPRAAGKAGGKARDAATVTSSSMRPRSCTTKTGHVQPGGGGKRKQSDATDAEVRRTTDRNLVSA
jgi:phytochrome-interacting factor 4